MSVIVSRIRSTIGAQRTLLRHSSDYEPILAGLGSPMSATWHRPRVELQSLDDAGSEVTPVDLPLMSGHSLVLTNRALTVLGDVLREHGEVLALENDGDDLYLFNCAPTIEALDVEHSEILRFPSGGVRRVIDHVFVSSVIGERQLFSVPETSRSSLYVTQQFVDLVTASRLTGLDFDAIWNSNS